MKPGKSQGEPVKMPPRHVRPQVVNPLNLGPDFVPARSVAYPTGGRNFTSFLIFLRACEVPVKQKTRPFPTDASTKVTTE